MHANIGVADRMFRLVAGILAPTGFRPGRAAPGRSRP